MDVKAFYNHIGGDYQDALERFGSDDLIAMFLMKYTKDKSFDILADAVLVNDMKTSFQAVHTLKGVAGNMSFKKLYECADALTEQLRSQTEQADFVLYQQVKTQQEMILAAIAQFMS